MYNKMGNDLKRSSKCESEKELSEFNVRTDTQKYRKQCCGCIKLIKKEYQTNNKDKINLYNRNYFQHNKSKIYESRRNRRKTDVNFRLICNTRRRIRHALHGKSKSISTKEILRIDIETYKKWIEWQMTPDMTWDNIEIVHIKPICMFDVTKDEELREAFNWKNTQPLLKAVHQQKGIKYNFLDYQLQFIKTHQFIKLNEERFNENIHG